MNITRTITRGTAALALPLFTLTTAAQAQTVLEVDLSVTDQVTITALTGVSAATTSGSDTTGVYLENKIGGTLAFMSDTLVSGDITSFLNTSDSSPAIYSVTGDPGLNIWTYTNDATSDFVAGTQAFAGSGTWTISATNYADLLAGATTGDVWAFADDISDLGGAVVVGQYTTILPSVATPFCFGDGSDGVVCPCSNVPALGSGEHCTHSQGVGSFLTASGSPTVGADSLLLTINQGEPNEAAIFISNTGNAGSGGTPFNIYDGAICVTVDASLTRHFTNPATGAPIPTIMDGAGMGTNVMPLSMSDFNGLTVPGATIYYQAWMRSPNGPCGGLANFSAGLSVTWN